MYYYELSDPLCYISLQINFSYQLVKTFTPRVFGICSATVMYSVLLYSLYKRKLQKKYVSLFTDKDG